MKKASTLERLPVSARIARLLLEKIERREFKPGEWLPTERELAHEFGADRATIRAAIAHLAQQHLIVREAGRRPWINPNIPDNRAPISDGDSEDRPNRPAPLQTIAAVIPQPPTYPALSLIQRGILGVLRQSNPQYRLIVFDNQGDVWMQSVAQERQALAAIANEGIAGAILWPIGGEETLPDIRRLQDLGIPLVLIDRQPDDIACDFVGADNLNAARDTVAYLCKLGHRRIAHLTSADAILTVREREQGYQEALLAHGIQPEEELIFRLNERDELMANVAPAVDHFFGLSHPPTALFALKDVLAYAFLNEMRARGKRAPEDMSVIGFDDHDRYGLHPPFLTTVHQPFENMGQKAAQMLLRRLTSPKARTIPFQHVLLPTPLVVRTSCCPPESEQQRESQEGVRNALITPSAIVPASEHTLPTAGTYRSL